MDEREKSQYREVGGEPEFVVGNFYTNETGKTRLLVDAYTSMTGEKVISWCHEKNGRTYSCKELSFRKWLES